MDNQINRTNGQEPLPSQITVREALTERDAAVFWEQLHLYFERDIFPDQEDEDREYFLRDPAYRANVQRIHDRSLDRCFYLFFCRDGVDIGFAMPVIYTTEDGKCFLMEFCVFPEFRGNGTGRECAKALFSWARACGARYTELNCSEGSLREHFWQSLGFVRNGADEWGEPLMILPPKEEIPVTVEVLSDPTDWQLKKLENGYLREIGEPLHCEEQWERLVQAVRDNRITFFAAKRGFRAVGMCSVARCFSTFACSDIGSFEDFYIEPAFRRKGIAGLLAKAAQSWCRENGIRSLTVSCAPCDEKMYQSLGFDTRLGTTLCRLS